MVYHLIFYLIESIISMSKHSRNWFKLITLVYAISVPKFPLQLLKRILNSLAITRDFVVGEYTFSGEIMIFPRLLDFPTVSNYVTNIRTNKIRYFSN